MAEKPVVLTFAGHDPCGGAGVQADIETINYLGCRAASVITTLTVQDSQSVKSLHPVDAQLLKDQAKAVLEDMPVAAFKLGLLGSLENINAIYEILHSYRDIPVIVDPVLRSGGGYILSDEEMTLAYSDLIFPFTTLLTPNSKEALTLAPESDNLDSCAQELMDDGCQYVFITGTHESTPRVINTLYHDHKKIRSFSCERLPHEYHGSGCTLAAAAAAFLAQKQGMQEAVEAAHIYTWKSLHQGIQLGMGQWHPTRCLRA